MTQDEREERAYQAVATLPEPGSLPAVSMPAPSVVSVQRQAVLDPAGSLGQASLDSVAEYVGYDGRYLKSAREGRSMSLEQVSEETKIAVRYLKAIEANDVNRLPAAVFVRGYLAEIASVLEIEQGALVEGYMALYIQQRGG